MIGDWNDHWEQLQALQQRLEDIADGREGGSVVARADLQSFFERSESLRDWAKKAIGDPAKIDAGMKASTPLSLAHDIAIKVKHQVQDQPPWSGAHDADIVSQSVAVTPEAITSSDAPSPATSAHQWDVRYTPPGEPPVTSDALQLSREVVGDWRDLLQSVGLLD